MTHKYSPLIATIIALSGCTTFNSCTSSQSVIEYHIDESLQPKSSTSHTVVEKVVKPRMPKIVPESVTKPKGTLSFGRPVFNERYHNQNEDLEDLLEGHTGQRKIVIDKSARELQIYVGDELIKSYGISLSRRHQSGPKQRKGDLKTPEGHFYAARKNPNSRWHKAIVISYPGKEDAIRGLKKGIITKRQYTQILKAQDECREPPRTNLGSLVEIHGAGGGRFYQDWTHGCASLNNRAMDEVYKFTFTGCYKGKPKTEIIIKR
ncbi:L,D-transpeptidase family protein [Candidatus Woesearchaeota archaeon]|jgi:hypothetical protein|nr:L,D-transpeptidase family protein [Candidatus Woesearchaeota archaeon]MBT4151392.1 L,D-transpeptidase family protein [Candidatus Woesearchaeota archaeon]MBT4247790.1 L,D-transpeptidase family protein [Candidatus Woesearchaeota archaeon]MBT4434214.1 L,D-transpeptidase family protein [Candidatus Woesearchaeota archaeon]MBT7332064.1 L,D-transpeptidase family protein [Candidatus Woesearchaeota archaeon]